MKLSRDPEARARQLEGARLAANPTPEQVAEGEKLVREGWVQLSHKYRYVARLPPGYSAVEALQEVDPEALAKIIEDSKAYVRDHARQAMLEHHGNHPLVQNNRLTLDIGTFAVFKKAGGKPW